MKNLRIIFVVILALVGTVHPGHTQTSLDARILNNIHLGPDPVILPDNQRAQVEPHIARSFSDPNLIIASWQSGRFATGAGSIGNEYAVSRDGGLTWTRDFVSGLTQGIDGGPLGRASDPVVAVSFDNVLFQNSFGLFDTTIMFTPPYQLTVSKMQGTDEALGLPVTVYTDQSATNEVDKNWIAINTFPGSSTDGKIAVLATLIMHDPNTNFRITNYMGFGVFSDDQGETWTEPVPVGPTNSFGLQPVWLPNGNLVVGLELWRPGTSTEENFAVVISEDGGQTFSDPIWVARDVTLNNISDVRNGWWMHSMTSDRLRGILYMTWPEKSATGQSLIQFARSLDGGHTWSTPGNVRDVNVGVAFNSAVSASPDGQHISILFYDSRGLTGTTNNNVYLAESFDGGETWEPNILVSAEPSDFTNGPLTPGGYFYGDYHAITPALNFETPGVAVWIDGRHGDPDPYVAQIARTQGTTFETWRRLRYSAEELDDLSISGESADQEGDGIVNLFEYIYATEPDVPSLSPLEISFVESPEDRVVVSYDRLAVITDLDFLWYGSENLSEWNEVEPLSEQTSLVVGNPILEHVEATFPRSQPSLFLRLGVGGKLTIHEQPQSQSVEPGETVMFQVTATGARPLTYQWRFDGIEMFAETNATLTIANVHPVHSGMYSVMVQDGQGSLTSDPAVLSVLVDPIIVQQPQSQTVPVGGTATFSVTVTNTATLPITYEWRKVFAVVDTQVLYEYTSTFSRTNVQAGDAVDYRVSVKNEARPFGFISDPAKLTVE